MVWTPPNDDLLGPLDPSWDWERTTGVTHPFWPLHMMGYPAKHFDKIGDDIRPWLDNVDGATIFECWGDRDAGQSVSSWCLFRGAFMRWDLVGVLTIRRDVAADCPVLSNGRSRVDGSR